MRGFITTIALFALAVDARRGREEQGHGPRAVLRDQEKISKMPKFEFVADDDDDCDEEFVSYAAAYGLDIRTDREYVQRRANFAATNKRIRQNNEGGSKYFLDHNRFSSMSEDEIA